MTTRNSEAINEETDQVSAIHFFFINMMEIAMVKSKGREKKTCWEKT